LAGIPEPIFDIVVAGANLDRDALARGGSNSLNFEVVTEALDDAIERYIRIDLTLEDTIKSSVILARRRNHQPYAVDRQPHQTLARLQIRC
jgi:putative restriction endonuclease